MSTISQPTPSPVNELSQTSVSQNTLEITSISMQPTSTHRATSTHTTKSTNVARSVVTATIAGHTIVSSSFSQSLAASSKLTATVRPSQPAGQSLVMLHVNKAGNAYLVPANSLNSQADSTALPVKLSAVPSFRVTNGTAPSFVSGQESALENTVVAPAAVLADNMQSPLTLAKMVSRLDYVSSCAVSCNHVVYSSPLFACYLLCVTFFKSMYSVCIDQYSHVVFFAFVSSVMLYWHRSGSFV